MSGAIQNCIDGVFISGCWTHTPIKWIEENHNGAALTRASSW